MYQNCPETSVLEAPNAQPSSPLHSVLSSQPFGPGMCHVSQQHLFHSIGEHGFQTGLAWAQGHAACLSKFLDTDLCF